MPRPPFLRHTLGGTPNSRSPENMLVVMREEQKIARRDLHLLAPVREPCQVRAVGQKMIRT